MGEERIPCPHCAELIKPQAIKCPFCKDFVGEGGSGVQAEELEALATDLADLTVDADSPPDLNAQPGKFRMTTWIWLLVAFGCVGACFIPEEAALVIGIISAFIFGLTFLVSIINDLIVPSPRGRRTAANGATAFLRSIRFGHWGKAYACISPYGRRNQQVEEPDFPDLEIAPARHSFAQKSGFKGYWKSFTRGSSSVQRRITGYKVQLEELEPNVQRARVRIEVEAYPQWILLTLLVAWVITLVLYLVMRKTHPIEFDMLLVKHKSQWWVLTGEAGTSAESQFQPGE